MARRKDKAVDRRTFLRSAAVGAAAAAVSPAIARAAREPTRGSGPPPMSQDAEVNPPAKLDVLTEDRSRLGLYGGRAQVIGFDISVRNPGSSIRGLHESVINYGAKPEARVYYLLHEESAVAMAHGYSKIEGKPIAVMAHGTVGLQHASRWRSTTRSATARRFT